MLVNPNTQRTLQVSKVDDYLSTWVEAFLLDRKAAGVVEGTLRFYLQKIKLFLDFCDAQATKQIGQINPSFLRQFLLTIEEDGHNAGGRHAAFRSLRAFLNWYEDDAESWGLSNPIHKVKAPKVPADRWIPYPLKSISHSQHR